MRSPARPRDEDRRLAALHALAVLDTPPEERFDGLTRLASRLFHAPIALVSLIDADRQWFKSRQGLEVDQTPRDLSFCGHAILGDDVFVVDDATRDERFADNPLVTGAPHVRFYAGAPLTAPGGSRIGTLCVIDHRPRRFDSEQRRLLRILAGMATRELEACALEAERRRQEDALRKSEAALRRSEAALREADRRKDRFIATLAHELRNPLAPIRSAAHIIKLRQPQDPATARASDIIDRQAAHMARLVDDLLDMSRITFDRIELKRRPERLSALIASAVEAARPALDSARHRFTLDVPAEPVVMIVDATRISQAILNLLDNAAKYTPHDGDIRLTATRTADSVQVVVSDNGIGIAPEYLDAIFEMFMREQAAGPGTSGGLGIGLALSRKLVELHGGTLVANSAGRDRGSEFVLTLPLKWTNGPSAGLDGGSRPGFDGRT